VAVGVQEVHINPDVIPDDYRKLYDNAITLPQLFFDTANKNPDAPAYRQLTELSKHSIGPFGGPRIASVPVPNHVCMERVRNIAAYCREIKVTKGTRVGVDALSRWEWEAFETGINAAGGVAVAIHSVDSIDQKAFKAHYGKVEKMIVENEELMDEYRFMMENEVLIPAAGPHPAKRVQLKLDNIISFEEVNLTSALFTNLSRLRCGFGFAPDIYETKFKGEPVETYKSLTSSDPAHILFTTSTTGEPKGVVKTHGMEISSLKQIINSGICNDCVTMFVMLPFDSHVFQKNISHLLFLLYGIPVYPRNNHRQTSKLTDTFKRNLKQDFRAANADATVVVPKILERMKELIISQLKSTPWGKVAKMILDHYIEYNSRIEEGLSIPDNLQKIHDYLEKSGSGPRVIAHIKKQLGGENLRRFVCGGAALDKETEDFYRLGLGFQVFPGYGLTELCPLSVNRPGASKPGTAGKPLDESVDVKVVDEILWARSPSAATEYIDRPDLQHNFDKDGFFCTNDKVRIDDDGWLKVKKRADGIIVRSNGKNISAEKIEDLIKTLPFINEAVVYGNADMQVALVSIKAAKMNPALFSVNMLTTDKGILTTNQTYNPHQYVWNQIVSQINTQLQPWEKIGNVCIVPELEIGHGITVKGEPRREMLQDKYEKTIEKLFNTSLIKEDQALDAKIEEIEKRKSLWHRILKRAL
jgi:long-chain acyl-CoA synthetase